MSTDRAEWQRLCEAKEASDTKVHDEWADYWKLQEGVRARIEALRLKIVLDEKLIPLIGWKLEQPRGHERLCICHDARWDDPVWKPIVALWTEADYHSSLVVEGEAYGLEGIVLRTDDSEMSMQFTPPTKLPQFIKSYGLVVDPGEVGEYREGLVTALAGIDKLLEALR